MDPVRQPPTALDDVHDLGGNVVGGAGHQPGTGLTHRQALGGGDVTVLTSTEATASSHEMSRVLPRGGFG